MSALVSTKHFELCEFFVIFEKMIFLICLICLKLLKRLNFLKFLKLQPYSFAALQPIVLFATELAGIERQALPGAGGVATGIGVS